MQQETLEQEALYETENTMVDLTVRCLVVALLIGGLGLASVRAYESVEDSSGPATAPPATTQAPQTTVTAPSEPTFIVTSTIAMEAVYSLPPVRGLSPEQIAAIEAEEAQQTDGVGTPLPASELPPTTATTAELEQPTPPPTPESRQENESGTDD